MRQAGQRAGVRTRARPGVGQGPCRAVVGKAARIADPSHRAVVGHRAACADGRRGCHVAARPNRGRAAGHVQRARPQNIIADGGCAGQVEGIGRAVHRQGRATGHVDRAAGSLLDRTDGFRAVDVDRCRAEVDKLGIAGQRTAIGGENPGRPGAAHLNCRGGCACGHDHGAAHRSHGAGHRAVAGHGDGVAEVGDEGRRVATRHIARETGRNRPAQGQAVRAQCNGATRHRGNGTDNLRGLDIDGRAIGKDQIHRIRKGVAPAQRQRAACDRHVTGKGVRYRQQQFPGADLFQRTACCIFTDHARLLGSARGHLNLRRRAGDLDRRGADHAIGIVDDRAKGHDLPRRSARRRVRFQTQRAAHRDVFVKAVVAAQNQRAARAHFNAAVNVDITRQRMGAAGGGQPARAVDRARMGRFKEAARQRQDGARAVDVDRSGARPVKAVVGQVGNRFRTIEVHGSFDNHPDIGVGQHAARSGKGRAHQRADRRRVHRGACCQKQFTARNAHRAAKARTVTREGQNPRTRLGKHPGRSAQKRARKGAVGTAIGDEVSLADVQCAARGNA